MLRALVRLLLGVAAVFVLASLLSFDPADSPLLTQPPAHPVHNACGIAGARLADALLLPLGAAAYAIPLVLLLAAMGVVPAAVGRLGVVSLVAGTFLVLTAGPLLLQLAFGRTRVLYEGGLWMGGFVGRRLEGLLLPYLGPLGAWLVGGAAFVAALLLLGEGFSLTGPGLGWLRAAVRLLGAAAAAAGRGSSRLWRFALSVVAGRSEAGSEERRSAAASTGDTVRRGRRRKKPEVVEPSPAPVVEVVAPVPVDVGTSPAERRGGYTLPGLELLSDPPPRSVDMTAELEESAQKLVETLASFGIGVTVDRIAQGPVISCFEVVPDPGVKVGRITALADDIALALRAKSVRILAPIPGKAAVGIEIPNREPEVVVLKDVVGSAEFRQLDTLLPLALGKDVVGRPLVADLTAMPHLLLAGTTGSGKTVCVNALILSILYRATPDEVKFILVDPKKVELAHFAGLPHLAVPVVQDARKAAGALRWAVAEMERRYHLLAEAGARHIRGFNEQVAPEERLPYIVIVIDELADLMMVAASSVEEAIQRLAQLSRAVGLHLVLATQRPSVDVITGTIKSNLPHRISFQVSARVDARTVLDMTGAERLLGRGDMLYLPSGSGKPIRCQGSFVSEEDVRRVVDFIKAQRSPEYYEDILRTPPTASAQEAVDDDPLYEEALAFVLAEGEASVSAIQRRFRIGYNRSARLVERMAREGYVGESHGSKPRPVINRHGG